MKITTTDLNPTASSGLLVKTGTLTGVVFDDRDRDGVQDKGEKPLSGVTVKITDASGKLVATVVTDKNGRYTVPLPPGSTR